MTSAQKAAHLRLLEQPLPRRTHYRQLAAEPNQGRRYPDEDVAIRSSCRHPSEPELPPIPKGESAFDLLERDIPEPVKLCDPWVIEGVNLIAGRPKLGKTTLERQKLAAAATASAYLDSSFTTACAVRLSEPGGGRAPLACQVQDGRLPRRGTRINPPILRMAPRQGRRGLLDRYLVENPSIRLVVIDSLTRFRVVPDVRVPAFMADYEAVNLLHDLSKKHPGVCFDVIHHTRKAKSEDPIDDISGTYGLTAAADSYLVMRHHADGAIMHVGGRLWSREESEYKIKRTLTTAGRWSA
jgi:hypothetical protein